MLFKKMRNSKMDSVEEDWAALNENPTALYLPKVYRSLHGKSTMLYRLEKIATD